MEIMTIIKEVLESGKICVIRTNTYTSMLSHLIMLFEEAKKDFPGIDVASVSVKQYGGRRYKHTFGIEFNPGKKEIPGTYEKIHALEFTL
jgi:hypothetical protein